MEKKPKAIVLGGPQAHIGLIENLQRRGYYIILVDYYENPLAKEVADIHIRESTLDKEKILDIARNLDVKLVINICLDQPIQIACYVAEKLGLPSPYSYKTALNVTNKVLMKRKMKENQIPTSRYLVADGTTDLDTNELKFPLIIKPSDGTGSLGIKKANNTSELKRYVEDALNISRTNQAIVEEFCEGIEVSIDCFVQNKKVNIIMMRKQYKMNDDKDSGMQSIGSITPVEISQKVKKRIEQVAYQISNAFSLNSTPLLIQAFIDNDDINVIEFAARIGGGTHFKNIKLNVEFDIINATVDSYLGIQTNIEHNQQSSYHATNIIYASSGMYGSTIGYENLIKQGIIEDFVNYKTKGMEIDEGTSSRNRVGAFLVKGNNRCELFRKIEIAINELEVLDIVGNSIMRKDIYLKEEV